MRDGNGHANVALTEGLEELWPVPGSVESELGDWRSLYERERERAEAAVARAEELRWAEVRARCEAGSWKWRWEASRRKLRAVIAETVKSRVVCKRERKLLDASVRLPWRPPSVREA